VSLAVARVSVTFSVGRSLSFSMPPTRTTSARPEATVISPWRSATPLLAQAASTRVAGTGVTPIASAMNGAVKPWPSNRVLL
jgi:hypothetical protein